MYKASDSLRKNGLVQNIITLPFGSGLISTEATESPRSVARLLVNRTGGAGGLSSSLDIVQASPSPINGYNTFQYTTAKHVGYDADMLFIIVCVDICLRIYRNGFQLIITKGHIYLWTAETITLLMDAPRSQIKTKFSR